MLKLSKRYRLLLPLLLAAILLVACASAGTGEQTVEATVLPPATATSTQTQPPTATFTLTPTSTKTATPTLTSTPIYKNPIAGLAPGQYVVYTDFYARLYAESLDGSTKVQITDFDTYTSSISPNNDKIAYLSPNEDALKIFDLLTGEIEVIKPDYLQLPYNPSWSLDGTKLVYNAYNELINDEASLYVFDLITQETEQITFWENMEFCPAWSPDGRWIIFNADHYQVSLHGREALEAADLYLLDVDCLNDPATCEDHTRQLTYDAGHPIPSWYPDSSKLLFTCNRGQDLCTLDLFSSEFNVLGLVNVGGRKSYPTVSHDGKWIAFTADTETADGDKNKDIYVVSAKNNEVQNLTNSPDEDEYFEFWLMIE